MLLSLTIATRGHIERGQRPALCIASDGLLYTPTKKKIYDAGGGVYGRVQEDLYRWRKRDDKDMLDIIMTIVLSGSI